MTLPTNCPLCNAYSKAQEVVTRHVYGDRHKTSAFFHCRSCDVRYQYPGLTPEEEANFYSAEFEGFMAGRSGASGGWQNCESHIQANEPTRIRRMKYVSKHLPQNASVLEVGCSSGFMLYPLMKIGNSCVGVEPSGYFGDFVMKQGIRDYDSVEKLISDSPEQKFDFIQHFFVLEHISKPLEFLKSLVCLLKPGGKLVFEIPNVADPLHSVYDIPAFERFYWSVAHPWYFSEKSLRFLLDQLKVLYEIEYDQRYDLSNHLIWARDGKPGGMDRFSKIFGPELDHLYKQTLIHQGKCDTLIGIITKD